MPELNIRTELNIRRSSSAILSPKLGIPRGYLTEMKVILCTFKQSGYITNSICGDRICASLFRFGPTAAKTAFTQVNPRT